MPENPMAAEWVTDAHIGSRTLREFSVSYWTSDSTKQVWDFYRQQLPDWPRNLVDTRGRELIHDEKDCVRLGLAGGDGLEAEGLALERQRRRFEAAIKLPVRVEITHS